MLSISKFELFLGDKKLCEGENIELNPGEKAILIGPNGSGKTSLFKAIIGIGDYKFVGRIELDGEDITNLPPEEKFKRGLFLFFQNTANLDIPINRLLNTIEVARFNTKDPSLIANAIKQLNLSEEFLSKHVSSSLSGGEKKKVEMLQLLISMPKYALIDEFDSGLDFDGINKFVEIINKAEFGAIIITHQASVSTMISANKYYLLLNGRLSKISREELERIIEKGYGH
jgi:Fe-S cluster assembly ATP-binding protein